MTIEDKEKMFDKLVRRSLVPKGFRPESDEGIEEMLDALGKCELSESKSNQMLRKIRGQEPMIWDREEGSTPVQHDDSTTDLREMVEMFRSKGDDVPPELQKKLRELEQQAAEEADEDNGEGGNDG
ncbi:hypothetical protein [Gimesia sp.]|uniref:hypothetical protein n=1 Tax=Gimesia sp. TaxID=2024833 RepID=UPI003A9460B0|tara:strand:- start:29710 stop:30087 length:378 start_codon:yes stop_codon:yes gene_type:complete